MKTVHLEGKNITRIHYRGDDYGVSKLSFEHENGIQEIYNQGLASSEYPPIEVPHGHRIVGVYAISNGPSHYLGSTGFITANFKE